MFGVEPPSVASYGPALTGSTPGSVAVMVTPVASPGTIRLQLPSAVSEVVVASSSPPAIAVIVAPTAIGSSASSASGSAASITEAGAPSSVTVP